MKVNKWSNLTVMSGIPLNCPEDGPQGFIPVFNTREEAIAWDDGSEEYVKQLETV